MSAGECPCTSLVLMSETGKEGQILWMYGLQQSDYPTIQWNAYVSKIEGAKLRAS